MTLWSWQWWLAYGSMGLLMLVGVLLMIIILLQRGRGGGLAGAFGGAGGQIAFGTRAGDVFTKITAVMAILWVFLAAVSRFALEPAANQAASRFQTEAEIRAAEEASGAVRSTGETDDDTSTDSSDATDSTDATDTKAPTNSESDPAKTDTPGTD